MFYFLVPGGTCGASPNFEERVSLRSSPSWPILHSAPRSQLLGPAFSSLPEISDTLVVSTDTRRESQSPRGPRRCILHTSSRLLRGRELQVERGRAQGWPPSSWRRRAEARTSFPTCSAQGASPRQSYLLALLSQTFISHKREKHDCL